MYLGWFDDSKKDAAVKIAEAVAAYQERFKAPPSVVLVHADESVPAIVAGCEVRRESYIRRNNFWVGMVEK